MHTDDAARHPYAYHTLRLPGAEVPAPDSGVGPVVVGVDGSDEAFAATAWAANVAVEARAEVVLVHALSLGVQLAQDITTLGLVPWRQDLEVALTTRWCAALRRRDVPHRVILAERPAHYALIGVAVREGASRLVIGTRSRALGAGSSGHLTSALIHHAPCPVICVPLPVDPPSIADEGLSIGVENTSDGSVAGGEPSAGVFRSYSPPGLLLGRR
jgi:nucleotide-binding universal stress UspA family protein